MGYIDFDPDEYKAVIESTPCRACGGDMTKCNGRCSGSTVYRSVRRPQAEIDAIKARKRQEHEDAILAEAAVILARREAKP